MDRAKVDKVDKDKVDKGGKGQGGREQGGRRQGGRGQGGRGQGGRGQGGQGQGGVSSSISRTFLELRSSLSLQDIIIIYSAHILRGLFCLFLSPAASTAVIEGS